MFGKVQRHGKVSFVSLLKSLELIEGLIGTSTLAPLFLHPSERSRYVASGGIGRSRQTTKNGAKGRWQSDRLETCREREKEVLVAVGLLEDVLCVHVSLSVYDDVMSCVR